MDSNTNRPGFSPVSTPETMSTFSEIESNISLDDNKDSSKSLSGHSNLNPEFAFADGNVELQTSDQSFWVHEYQLSKFAGFSELIQEARRVGTRSDSNGRIILTSHSAAIDIYNTLRVIYASVVSGPPEFDIDTLTSALRVATTYDYSDLRSFAVSSLEKVALAPIDRIRLSDEFSLPSWEKPAFAELCQRKEPVSILEAQVLGIERFTHVARIRETEQRQHFLDNIVNPIRTQCLRDAETKLDHELPADAAPISIPTCDCRHRYNGHLLHKCGVHETALRVLNEYNSLLEERNNLLQRLKDLPSMITKGAYSELDTEEVPRSSISEDKCKQSVSLDEVLGLASWIRHVGQID